ncbi:MAG: hypothetical protein ACRD2S_10595 [Terriglobales bacterium]
MKPVLTWCVIVLLATSLFAQTSPTVTAGRKKAAAARPPAVTSQDIQSLRDALAAQQLQIEQLRQELARRDQDIQQSQQQAQQAQTAAAEAATKADQAAATASQQQQAVGAIQTDVSDLKQSSATEAMSLKETQKSVRNAMESPLALRYKGITITPGGFLAAETVWRKGATGGGINTSFNSIPLPGSSQDHMSEFFASGRQSRVAMLAEGKIKSAKLSGYVEADFLTAGITSNNNESNSYGLRQRQAWAQAYLNNGWSFTGGQMWSLVTETKNGVDNRTEVLPMTIDSQYNVGFSWARQYGFRVAKDFGNKFWLAFSAENAQTTVGGEGAGSNFLIGSAGASGGLYNPSSTYSFNKMPDFVAKAVFQPTKVSHIEVFGLVSQFRDRIFPGDSGAKPTAAGAFNNGATGAGVGLNMRADLFNKHIDAGIHFLGGEGIGRYGTVGLPDVYVRPDGVLGLTKSTQALGTLEYHNKKLDLYSNVGGEYAGRSSLSTTSAVGYGSPLRASTGCYSETIPGTATGGQFPTSSNGFLPGGLGSCNVDTRNVIEGTLGFWYRFYSGPMGKLQWGPQFSYIVKNTWRGTGGAPSASEPMVLTSFRYYLP